MRVTNQTLVNNYKNNVNRNLKSIMELQNQMATGKQFRTVSDDPFGVAKTIGLDNQIAQAEQFENNIEEASSWIQLTDSSQQTVITQLNRIRELVQYGANGSMSESDVDAVRMEYQQVVQGVVDTLNVSYDGRYIFSGQETLTVPFEYSLDGAGNIEVTYLGDSGDITREISQGVTMDINVTGTEIMDGADIPESLADTLKAIDVAFEAYDSTSLSDDLLSQLDSQIDNFLRLEAEVGANDNRLIDLEESNANEQTYLTELLSLTEDVDIAEATVEYSQRITAYQASLSTAAKVIQTSLFDYLQ
jgi:flagellar hook-associated protein 3 FlgL